ncbi:MAG: DUF2934 domain-containing protein [Verrucomicrobiota bacterium]
MDPPSSSVPLEALQRRAYLLAEAAGFPADQSEHFWLMAEQQLTPTEPPSASAAPARKVPSSAKRKPPATQSIPAAEAAPVHPTRKKAAAKSAAPKPAAKVPAKPAAKAPAIPAAKPPVKPATPAAKSPAKPRKPKAGDAS